MSGEQFVVPESVTVPLIDEEEPYHDDLSTAWYHSQASTSAGKGKGVGKRSRPSLAASSTVTAITSSTSGVAPSPAITQTDLSEAVRQWILTNCRFFSSFFHFS